MSIIAMGLGNATLGRRTRSHDGDIITETPAKWEYDPAGGCLAIWPLNPETMEPSGPAEIFGDWDAGHYLPKVLDMIKPNRRINVPDLASLIRKAAKDGLDICEYCPGYGCQECIVDEWKEDNSDE